MRPNPDSLLHKPDVVILMVHQDVEDLVVDLAAVWVEVVAEAVKSISPTFVTTILISFGSSLGMILTHLFSFLTL